MAGLKCLCGNGMSNSTDPNENTIKVYKKEDVDSAINDNPNLSLIDFDTKDWAFEYWYCPNCGRVHMVESIPCGKVVRRFIRSTDNKVALKGSSWECYYVFSDKEIYDAEEEDQTLTDYIDKNGESHFYWFDRIRGEVYKKNEGFEYQLLYVIEKSR